MSSAICRNISNTSFPASSFQNISKIFPKYFPNISITSFSASSFQKGRRSMKKEGLRAKKITMSNKSFLAVKEKVNIVNIVNIVNKRNVYSPVFAQGVRRNMGGKVNMTA